MKSEKTQRGFVVVDHPGYTDGIPVRLVQESSAIADYDTSMDCPGSSYLWVGEHHHLDREEVKELVERMQHWLDTSRLFVDGEGEEDGGSIGDLGESGKGIIVLVGEEEHELSDN